MKTTDLIDGHFPAGTELNGERAKQQMHAVTSFQSFRISFLFTTWLQRKATRAGHREGALTVSKDVV